MDTLLQFGDGGLAGRQYDFEPKDQISLSSNFSDVVTQTVRVLGARGGFNQYGRGAAPPTEVGTISYTYWLYFDGVGDAIAQRDALMEMSDWGLQRLYMRPQDTGEVRWCWAMVNNSPANFNAAALNHRRMRVTVTFHVPDPHWYKHPYTITRLDEGYTLSDGRQVGGVTKHDLTGATTIDLTVDGTARALPTIWVDCGDTGAVNNIVIVRRDRDTLRETHRIKFGEDMGNLDRLRINCASQNVVYEKADEGNIDGWYAIERSRANMLELMPGTNRLEISGDFTNTVKIWFDYLETYR